MTATDGQATAMLHALYGRYTRRPLTHAEKRAQAIDELDRDDRDNGEVAA